MEVRMSERLIEKDGSTGHHVETMTVKEIGAILRIGTNSAYNLIHTKSFPVLRVGNSYRIPVEPFYRWLNQTHCNKSLDFSQS